MTTFKRLALAVLFVAVLSASPAFAYLPCDQVCSCGTNCGIHCYDNGGIGPLVTCGSGGYLCVSNPICRQGEGGGFSPGNASCSPTDLSSFLSSLQAR